jgi:threonine dehydratase
MTNRAMFRHPDQHLQPLSGRRIHITDEEADLYSLETISLQTIRSAQERIRDMAIRTPLIRLNVDDAPAEIFLKLENLQPIGAFKIRSASNAIRVADRAQLDQGVWTASAGNMAQAVAWCARRLGLKCTVVVPDTASTAKLAGIERLGAKIVFAPFRDWLEIYRTRSYTGMEGVFIHAFSDPAVMAGNGTIALEILDDLPDVDAVIAPYGGGGLACGVAAAFRQVKPDTKCYAAEVETAAPVSAAFAAGAMVEVAHTPSFVDGIGAPLLFSEMWAFARQLLDGALVSSLAQITASIRLLADRNHVIAEGAGAAAVAAALSGQAGGGKVVCIVSGGNIDAEKLAKILADQIP